MAAPSPVPDLLGHLGCRCEHSAWVKSVHRRSGPAVADRPVSLDQPALFGGGLADEAG